MRFISHIIFLFFSNIVAFLIADYFIDGFSVSLNLKGLAMAALIFTLINIFVRPILKLILSPIVFLTLGLGIILVNALTLFILDLLSTDITISYTSFKPLLFATLIVSFINIIINFSAKSLFKRAV